MLRWTSFAKSKRPFFIEESPLAEGQSNADTTGSRWNFARKDAENSTRNTDPYGLSLSIEGIRNWHLPQILKKDLDDGFSEVKVHISLSLLNKQSLTFFGTTWVGAPIPLLENSPAVIDIGYKEIAYILSRLRDPSCLGIIEVVATKYDKETRVTTAQYGCGWASIDLFSPREKDSDISDGWSEVEVASVALREGSPRDLLGRRVSPDSFRYNDAVVDFKLYSHRKLLRMSSLVKENCVIGRFDIVPGLVFKEVTLPGSTRKKSLPCVGDREVLDENHGKIFIIPGTPQILESYTSKVSNCQLIIPDRVKHEHAIMANVHLKSAGEKTIRSRSIKIGFHNGHTFINNSCSSYDLEVKRFDNDVLRISEDTIVVEGYVPHELVALVMIVEYLVSAPGLKHAVPVTIGASIFIPLRGDRITLQENHFNDKASPFDLQLEVANMEACEALTPSRYAESNGSFETPRLGFDIKMHDNNGNSVIHGQEILIHGDKENHTGLENAENSFVGSDIDSLPDALVQGDTFRSSFRYDQTQTSRPSELIETIEFMQPEKTFDEQMRTSSVLGGDDVCSRYDEISYTVLPRVNDFSRQLSRGTVSKLTRYGFDVKYGSRNDEGKRHLDADLDVDIVTEAQDKLPVNEVTIQFAAFRTESDVNERENVRRIQCNYQFYTSEPVWTENLRVLSSDQGELGVLMCDEVHARSETPQVYRHIVNCNELTADEVTDFAEYLHDKILYVDVWDADSLLLIGTCAVPLRQLMRQGRSSVKYSIECDVIDAEMSKHTLDGISTVDIVSNGPLIGVIAGSLNILMSNTGRPGNDSSDKNFIGFQNHSTSHHHQGRATTHTRAKALKDSEPALSKALNDQANNRMLSDAPSGARVQGSTGLTYDDLVRVFKRFAGSIKGTVQYHGALMNLLEIPTINSAISNLMKIMKATRARGINVRDLANSLCDEEGNFSLSQLKEFLARVSASVYLNFSAAEIAILSNKYTQNGNQLHVSRLLDLIEEDIVRLDWLIVARKFKSALQVAMSSGIDLNRVFAEYDKGRDGHISVQGFMLLLQSLSSFTNFSSTEASNVASYFSRRSGNDGDDPKTCVSVRAIFAYLGLEYNANISNSSHSEKIVQTFAKAIEKGSSMVKIFIELDNDHDGHLSSKELQDGLYNLGNFEDFSLADADEFISQFNTPGDKVSKEEFINYFESRIHYMNLHANTSKTESTRVRIDDIAARLKLLVYQAAKTGTSEELFFSYLDVNHNGLVSFQELDDGLTRFDSFTRLSCDEIQMLVGLFDNNCDGNISLAEFQKFIRSENLTKKALRHHLRRIAEPDGGIAGLLAFLDSDNDGFVSRESFLSMCSREAIFDLLSKRDCEALISPICNSGIIPCSLLLKLIEDDTFDPFDLTRKEVDDADTTDLMHEKTDEQPFIFDSDPEVRATEKKLRSISRSLVNSGFDLEGLFRQYDSRNCGMIRRNDFIEILTRTGLYAPEKGRPFSAENDTEDVVKLQQLQIQKMKNISSDVDESNVNKRVVDRSTRGDSPLAEEFRDYKESVALVNSYREGQKQMMLQKVLSQSLSSSLEIYPRFGKTLFFELPVKNPFDHEHTFFLEMNDSELKLVTHFDEWLYLRQTVRPCSKLGDEPFDANVFNVCEDGRVAFTLLPNEVMCVPFKFCSLNPHLKSHNPSPDKVIEARVLSSTYGVMNVFKIDVHLRPNRVTRNIYLFETENTVFKRKINVLSYEGRRQVKYTHCIESSDEHRVVVEQEKKNDSSSYTQILLRYRCPQYPKSGNFYILVYDDEYHAVLSEIWLVVVQSKLKLDVTTAAGSLSSLDLVIRGDRYGRRVKVYSNASSRLISFNPSSTMQMSAGVFNRIVASICPINIGRSKLHINLVDVDSLQLVSSWLLNVTATSPIVMRQYEVLLDRSKYTFKKISFQNPWDISRRFKLTSSNDAIMKPRDEIVDVLPQGTALIRLWFAKGTLDTEQQAAEVYLFLNDSVGNGEECFLFNISNLQ